MRSRPTCACSFPQRQKQRNGPVGVDLGAPLLLGCVGMPQARSTMDNRCCEVAVSGGTSTVGIPSSTAAPS